MIGRFLTAVAAVLFLASMASADYTQVGSSNYYTNSSGDYFGARNVYFGYYYDYYGRYIPRYYWVEYYPLYPPATTLTPDSPETAYVALLKNRETWQAKILLDEQRTTSFERKLKAIGVSAPFQLNYQKQLTGGAYGVVTGNSLYGYGNTTYSLTQSADTYGAYDPVITQQGGMALIRQLTSVVGQATTDINGISERDAQRAERLQAIKLDNERVLTAQKIEGELSIRRIEALRPPNRFSTTITGSVPVVGNPSVPIQPAPFRGTADPDDGSARLLRSETATANCASCHSGGKVSGNLDITKPLTAAQHLAIINRVSLPANNPKHMPLKADGGPGRQLNATEIGDLLPKADENEKVPPPKPDPEPKVKPAPKAEPKTNRDPVP